MSTLNLNPVNILIYGNVLPTVRTSPGTTCSELRSVSYSLMNVAMSTGDARERGVWMSVRGEVWTTRGSGRDSLGFAGIERFAEKHRDLAEQAYLQMTVCEEGR